MTSPRYARQVGELYNPAVTSWPDERMEWTLSPQGVELLLTYSHPSDAEVDAVRRGPARFALLAGDGALILAHRFEPLPWADTPWQASRQRLPVGVEAAGDGERLIVSIVLVDAATGVIKAVRVVTWPERFATAMAHAVLRQAQTAAPDEVGAREIEAWYRRYPSTPELVRAADITCRA